MDKVVLFELIVNALKSVRDSSIGEGEFGIVVDKFPSREFFEVCAKYHKFSYNANEYMVLVYAHELGLPVPEPLGEWPQSRVFAMKRVIGKTLKELEDYQFSEDVVAGIRDALVLVSRFIFHGDLRPGNVMLEDIVIQDGVIVGGDPYVIDFGKSEIASPERTNREYEGLMSWLGRRLSTAVVQ